MSKPAHLLRIGITFLVLAAISGALVGPAMRTFSRAWFNASNWAIAILWLGAAVALIASGAMAATMTTRSQDIGRMFPPKPATRLAVALAVCWLCSLPHAYLWMPHFKMALPMYVAGIEAYAIGNALAAFVVCIVILVIARRRADGGIKAALVAAVLVNAAFLFDYF